MPTITPLFSHVLEACLISDMSNSVSESTLLPLLFPDVTESHKRNTVLARVWTHQAFTLNFGIILESRNTINTYLTVLTARNPETFWVPVQPHVWNGIVPQSILKGRLESAKVLIYLSMTAWMTIAINLLSLFH